MKRVGKGFSRRDTPLFPTMMVQAQQEQGEGLAIPTDPHNTPTIIQPSTSQPQKKQRSRSPKRKDTELPQPCGPTTNVADEAVYKERDDSLERASTTATGLDAEQDRGNINKTQFKATPNEPSSPGTSSGGGPRSQETMRDIIAQTRSENVSKFSNDPLLARDCSSLGDYKFETESQEVKEERRVKNSQAQKIIQAITLVDETQGRYGDDIMFDVSDFAGEEVFVAEQGVFDKDVNLSVDEVTLAQALAALKSAKVQEKANVVVEPTSTYTNSFFTTTIMGKDLGQGLQAEFDEQERIEREKIEANIALKETWDDIQAKIEADQLLAERLQAREQEELTIEEKAILFQQLLEKRRKHFAAKRVEEKRNRPPTKAQQRSIITELVEESEVRAEGGKTRVEGSSKRAGEELEQESSKKQKLEEDKETAELQRLIEVVPDKEKVAINAIPLETKPPSYYQRRKDP
ncbi:hypothetical protein Tco_0922325 [Tanacetum coccineum]|uniref:Uncharacterized protein n=1 Tax=Tanacetum coccineum TaxID=301880 RepID=A0ABQ5D133_9ASTR